MRKTIVKSAQYWFDLSHHHGKNEMAVFAMENAFNHTENALAACLRIMTEEQRAKLPKDSVIPLS